MFTPQSYFFLNFLMQIENEAINLFQRNRNFQNSKNLRFTLQIQNFKIYTLHLMILT